MEGRSRWFSEFEVRLIYRVDSRTVKATQKNTVSKKKKFKEKTMLLKSLLLLRPFATTV